MLNVSRRRDIRPSARTLKILDPICQDSELIAPRFRIALQPGAFRVEDDPGPFAEALRTAPAAPVSLPTEPQLRAAASGLQALVDRFRTEAGGRTVVGALPVHVTFPTFGSSTFLASELSAESLAPSIDLTFRRQ